MNAINQTNHHDAITELLPWYVNGTLDAEEREYVKRHLEVCEECRDDVDLLSRVQRVVRTDSPAPLVPRPRAGGLLDAIDGKPRRRTPMTRWRWLAAAAAVLLVVAINVYWFEPGQEGAENPGQFETATSQTAPHAVNYVVELRFVADADETARQSALSEIDAGKSRVPVDGDVYRVTVTLGAVSLAELARYVEGIEARPEIAAADVVAVQLPVE